MQMFCITRIIDQNKHFLESKEMIISFTHDVNVKKSLPNIIIEGIPVEVVLNMLNSLVLYCQMI